MPKEGQLLRSPWEGNPMSRTWSAGLTLLAGVGVLGVAAPALPSADQPAPQAPKGFEAVFNGRDLTGWEGSPKYWKVEDGCLTGTADGKLDCNRFLVWKGGKVKNFELRVQVKVSPGGNSGINYRSTERPDLGESVVTGYQCDVVASRADYNGMLYEERGRRILAHTGEKVIIDPQGQHLSGGRGLGVRERQNLGADHVGVALQALGQAVGPLGVAVEGAGQVLAAVAQDVADKEVGRRLRRRGGER
jgi:Domain of Unknown Function (DUF1080)